MTVLAFGWSARARASEAPVVVRPVASVPGLAAHCDELSRRAGVDGRTQSSVVLFGSALRAAWTGERWRDINVALDAEAMPRSIIADADFTVCQVAVHDEHLFYGARFLEDVARRAVIVSRIDPCAPLVTLLRMYKYAARGYVVAEPELHRVLEAVRRSPRTRLDEAAVLRHGGGAVIP